MDNSIRKKKKEYHLTELFLIAGLLIVTVVYLSVGPTKINLLELLNEISNHDNGSNFQILLYIRLPRTLACMIVGSSLACSGLLLQAILNNSLASPGIIGINSGAGFGVVLFACFFSGSVYGKTIGAFLGSLLATFLVYSIARLSGAGRGTIVLSGVAISSLLSALIDAIVTLKPTTVSDRSSFSIGSFHTVSIDTLKIVGPLLLVLIFLSWLYSRRINILILGDEPAESLGINVKQTRFYGLVLSAFLAAGAVSIAGLLGFLGLIVPNLARTLFGVSDYRRLITNSALIGAIITLICDFTAKMLFAPCELPVGIPLALLGVPFFLSLLLSKGRRHRYDSN